MTGYDDKSNLFSETQDSIINFKAYAMASMTKQKLGQVKTTSHHYNVIPQLKQGAVVAQWIRPLTCIYTLSREVPGSNLLAAAVCTLSSLPSPSEMT